MYNGMAASEITDKACNMGSIFSFKDGIITRGVLMDIPRLKGMDYLDPGHVSIRRTWMPGRNKLTWR